MQGENYRMREPWCPQILRDALHYSERHPRRMLAAGLLGMMGSVELVRRYAPLNPSTAPVVNRAATVLGGFFVLAFVLLSAYSVASLYSGWKKRQA